MLTTGLLSGARYVKDNRPLPRGFDKTTVSDDIAVRGEASADPNFGSASDQLRYVLDLPTAPGPLTIGVELRYQPIGYRWAQNFGGYDARETTRFLSYYDAMAAGSTLAFTQTSVVIEYTPKGGPELDGQLRVQPY